MTNEEVQSKKAGKSAKQEEAGATPTTAEMAELAQQRLHAMIEVQKEFLDTLEQMNRDWFERAKVEGDLASELVSKLVGASSIPAAAIAYQEWVSRQLVLMAEDSRRLFSGGQKFMEQGMRIVSAGLTGASA